MKGDTEETQEVTENVSTHTRMCFVTTLFFFVIDRRTKKTVLGPPDDVEDGRAKELVVDGRRHVARLVEG